MYALYQSTVKASIEMQQPSSLSLLELSDGPLSDILEFLSIVDIAAVEAVCKELRISITLVWKKLDGRLAAPRNYYDRLLSPKDRVVRWTKASEYARRMERIGNAQHHCDHTAPYHILHCPECSALPELDTDFDQDSSREFFVRLSYPANEGSFESRVVWQGFVAQITCSKPKWFVKSTERRLSMNNLHHEWPEIENLLRYNAAKSSQMHDDSIWRHFLNLHDKCLEHLSLTVIAMTDACPYTSSLVVTTGRVFLLSQSRQGQLEESFLSLRHVLDHKMTVATSFRFINAELDSLVITYDHRLLY